MARRSNHLRAAIGGLLLLLLAWPSAALADAPMPGEVLVILAKEEGPTDPELQKIEALQKPPFSSYKSKKLLKKHVVQVAADKPARVELPNGSGLTLKLLEKLADGRAKIEMVIAKPGKKGQSVQVMAKPGEPIFIAGQKHAGGILFIGVQVGKKG